MPTPILKLDINGQRFGPGKAKLLELIAQSGSISQAAKKMDMSYRRAWLLIDELNKMFGSLCVETSAGGAGGGGAKVTPFGMELIAKFRKLEAKLRAETEKTFSDVM